MIKTEQRRAAEGSAMGNTRMAGLYEVLRGEPPRQPRLGEPAGTSAEARIEAVARRTALAPETVRQVLDAYRQARLNEG